jgi:hypothetical protein
MNALGLTRRGQPLKLRKWRNSELHGLHGKARESMRRKLLRREYLAAGLTVYGKPRIRRQWPRDLSKTELNTMRCRYYRQHRYARGLTARGKHRLSEKERAWRTLRAEMNIIRPDVLGDLERAA